MRKMGKVMVIGLLFLIIFLALAIPPAQAESSGTTTVSFSIKPAILIHADGRVESNVSIEVIRVNGAIVALPL